MRNRAFIDSTDRRLLRLAVPAFFTLIAEPLYIIVDTAIVGRIGTAELGGLALAGTMLSAVTWIFGFLATGITTQVGQRRGAGDDHGAVDAVAQGFYVALFVSALSTVVLGVGGPSIARRLGGRADVLEAASTYIRIASLGVPALLLTLLAVGWFRGTAQVRMPLLVAIGANVANVILEVLFVYGFGWGLRGSAWATVLVQWGALVVLARIVLRAVRPQPPRPAAFASLLQIGGAMMIRTALMVGTITASTSVAARLGKQTLGAHQITIQVYFFLALAVDALAISSQTVFAEETGRGDVSVLWPIVRRLVRLGAIAGVALAVVLGAVSSFLPSAFSADPGVRSRAAQALALCAVMQVSGSVVFVLDGILMGAGRFASLAMGAVVAAATFAALAVIARRNGFGVSPIAGVWIALNGWMLVRMIGNCWFAWRHLRTVH